MTFAPVNDNGELIEFALGTLDSGVARHPDAHIYVGSKANWYQIQDDLPQYDAGRASKRVK